MMTLKRPLFWLSLAFIAGVALARTLSWPLAAWLWLAGAGAAAVVGWRLWAHRWPGPAGRLAALGSPLPAIFLLAAVGGLRWQATRPVFSPGQVAWYTALEEKIVLEGVVVSLPDERQGFVQLRVAVERLRVGPDPLFKPVNGLVLANLPLEVDWRYGDRIRLEGQLQSPDLAEQASYREALARQNIQALLSFGSGLRLAQNQGQPWLALIHNLRRRTHETILKILPDPDASLLAGILIGIDTGMPPAVDRAFQVTGTAHIIAISGFNITIISQILAQMLRRLGLVRGAVAAAVVISLYCILAGASPSVVRAGIFGLLTLLANLVGRRQEGLTSLAFVAALMAWHNPAVLWDVSFQLSFTATLGLVLYAEPLTQAFGRAAEKRLPAGWARRLSGPVGEYFLVTLAAQLTTLPVILVHFQRLSLIGLAANPLVLPVQPAVMMLGGLAAIGGLFWLPLGTVLATLAWPGLAYTIRMAEALAQFPGASLAPGRTSVLAAWVFYGLLLGVTTSKSWAPAWASKARDGFRKTWRPSLALSVLAPLGLLVWQAVLFAPDGRLHLTLLNTGQGDGVLIQTPEGRYVLINGGSDATRLSDALGRRMPLLHRWLDWLIVAATEDEQLAGVAACLEQFKLEQVLWSGPPAGSRSARSLQKGLGLAGIPIHLAQEGQVIDLGQGARLEAVAVTPRGSVWLLAWNGFRVLLPLGLDFETLDRFQGPAGPGPLTAVLLSDSGFAPLNPPEWIAALQPELALLSVEAGNQRGLPDAEVLEALQGVNVLRTDQVGWIQLVTDGKMMWVETEK